MFFPGKGLGPGFSLCSVPFLLGVVFSGVGGFPLDKNHAQNLFSRENKSQITKNRCSKNGLPRPKSLCVGQILKNAKVSKNRSSKLQIIEKNSGPRTTCFLDRAATSAIEIGGEKDDQPATWSRPVQPGGVDPQRSSCNQEENRCC